MDTGIVWSFSAQTFTEFYIVSLRYTGEILSPFIDGFSIRILFRGP